MAQQPTGPDESAQHEAAQHESTQHESTKHEAAQQQLLQQEAMVLSALAEPHRHSVLHLLERQQLSQSDLVRELGISQPLVSHHLKVLREAQLIEAVSGGRTRLYRLRSQPLAAVGRRLTAMAERASTTTAMPG